MCSILTYCSPEADPAVFEDMLAKTASRGPDDHRTVQTKDGLMGFNRLSIMGLHDEGMQPFLLHNNACVCNGELYGFRPLRSYLQELGYQFQSDSDCELLLPLYEKLGTAMFGFLNAEFALVIYDAAKRSFIAARDPIGIRPLYYGYDAAGAVIFASEPKNLTGICEKIRPFPPGYFCEVSAAACGTGKPVQVKPLASEVSGSSSSITDMAGTADIPDPVKSSCIRYKNCAGDISAYSTDDLEETCRHIHDLLVQGVKTRLDADAPIGFLLSGGLDSSLVCGIAAKELPHPLETFAIGMDVDAIDLKYAREVAEYIHSNHHEVIITKEDVLNSLEDVIHALGTYDITTIRASIGMYLVCKWIHENTDIRVILTGEISDELFGYKYTDFAPDAAAFQQEAQKRIREIHMYDVLRADRSISVHSLEARVPFGDLEFVDYVMSIDPEKKMNKYGIGKYLLRHAFEKDGLIPYSILMREKAAFSDAVGHSLRDDIVEYAEQLYSDQDLAEKSKKYSHAAPFTKESLLYREIFEKYYPGQSEMVVDFWMPNREWDGCNVTDPSARVLANYGASGT